MAKPLNEFGGWLTLFRISNLLGAALLSAAIVFLSMATMMHLNLKLLLASFLIIAESSLTLYFIVKILRALKIKEKETPGKIIGYLKYSFIATVIFSAIEITLNMASHAWIWTGDDMSSLRLTIQAGIYFVIWSGYFKNSRRVAAYYAPAPETAAQVAQAPAPQPAPSSPLDPG